MPENAERAGKALVDIVPRVFLQLFDAEGDPVLLLVEIDDLDLDLLTEGQHIRGFVHPMVGDLGDMDQTVHPADVDKGAEIGQRSDRTRDHGARLELLPRLGAEFFLLGADQRRPGNHELAVFGLEFEDLEGVGLTEVAVEIFAADIADVRHRAEAPHAGDGDIEPTLAATDDLALDGHARLDGNGELLFELKLDSHSARDPDLLAHAGDDHLDRIAGAEIFEFVTRQNCLGLARDVDQSDVTVDGHDGALDQIADLGGFGVQAFLERQLEFIDVAGIFGHGRPRTLLRAAHGTGRIAQEGDCRES